jgi:hypothetical protein
LGILPESEAARFESHLLSCQSCFEEVQQWSRAAKFLREDDGIKREIEDAVGGGSPAGGRSLRRLLWPDAPLMLRPGLLLLLVALLVYPAFLGLTDRGSAGEAAAAITLLPVRGGGDDVLIIDGERTVVIAVVYEGALPYKAYDVALEDKAGRQVFRDRSFRSFDRYETGRIVLDASTLSPGPYRLSIDDSVSAEGRGRQEYRFTVARRTT